MDIIISGPKAGQRRKAAMLLTGDCDRVVTVTEEVGTTIGATHDLTEWLRGVAPDAIIFDGVILSPAAMVVAVTAVRNYRQHTGRPDTIAVYVEDPAHTCVVLTDLMDAVSKIRPADGTPVIPMPRRAYNTKVTNEFKHPVDNYALMSDEQLGALWDRAAYLSSSEDRRAMLDTLATIQPAVATAHPVQVPPLTESQRAELGTFLANLIKKYE